MLRAESLENSVAPIPATSVPVIERARSKGYQLFWVDDATVGISVDETTTADDLAAVAWAFGLPEADEHDVRDIPYADAAPLAGVPSQLARVEEYLTHPVFNTHRSETAMMRYLKQLSDRDYALDRGMIPLGSCTMKLNATTEMEPITWSEFANLHPFAPADQAEGYAELVSTLEAWLAELTGFDLAAATRPASAPQ